MTASTEDLDRFTNSLSAELGIDTVTLLSAEKEERPFIGAEALAAYAVYPFGIFASTFLEFSRPLDRAAMRHPVWRPKSPFLSPSLPLAPSPLRPRNAGRPITDRLYDTTRSLGTSASARRSRGSTVMRAPRLSKC